MNKHGVRPRSGISVGYTKWRHRIVSDYFYVTFSLAILLIAIVLALMIKSLS